MDVEVPPPPFTLRDEQVDLLHGVPVDDPYRWLEDGSAPEVRDWVERQNERTDLVLQSLPGRSELHTRLAALLRAGSAVACQVAGDRVFSLDRWGHHQQSVLAMRSSAAPGGAEVLVDPHRATGDPTAAIDWYHPSPDGALVAYGLSRGGDEQSVLHVLDVESKRNLLDRIPHTRACSVAWLPDGTAFAYTRYPDPTTVPDEDQGYWRKVYWHVVGEPPSRDELLWADLPDKTAWPNVSISRDGRYLLVHVALGWSRVDVHLIDRRTRARTAMIEGVEAVSQFSVLHDHVIGVTTLDADRGRIVRAPIGSAWHDQWETIVPESDRVVEAFAVTAASLVVLSSSDAVSHLDRYDHDGTDHRAVRLPELGSLAGLSGSRDRDEVYFSFTSFARPPTLFRWSHGWLADWSLLDRDDLEGDGPQGDYVVEQVRYPSADGTEVTMFLVRAADTVPGPDTHCVLTGYGGFAITMGPAYSAAVVAVCDDGGIYAVANIRGGAEQGEAWHRAGMREHKQRTFDDFLAACDWLVDQGLTSRRKLAIRGGSNGGLLMGAAITQRPDLCQVAQIAVPLLDMLRYHRFLIAKLWVPEYGDPEVAEEFAWLHEYSPYHRVAQGTAYPAVLLTTADHDSRVDPMHARKMTAALQHSNSRERERPALLRIETKAGHGQGKPVDKQADELADVLAFLNWQLGVDTSPSTGALPLWRPT